ncbi:MAG TPA: FliH/SctL family protein [Pyrinomonadaceae bacterium]|jgi:flagellar assembly protein FliH|nr:FliH/SctL family protein [Pyrinomonadaceae bacterium]
MNTLAKVLRSESAANTTVVLPFTPDELGNGLISSGPSSTNSSGGSQVYQFPVLDLSTMHNTAAKVINTGSSIQGTHNHTFPAVDELPVEALIHENDNSVLEKAMREKSLQEMRASVEAEINYEIGSLRENLAATIDRIADLANEITAKLETEAVALALEIAKKVVAREVSIDQEVVLSVTKNALSKLHSRSLASLHLHPDDLSFVQEQRNKLNFHGSLELIEDASVTPGGCLIHTDTGDIDARIETQFDEITNGLLGADTH